MAGVLLVRRSTGVFTGTLLVLLGAWGILIPFVGPYFHYAYTPDGSWTYTMGRLWMEILPGACAVLGGLMVSIGKSRPVAFAGAWLAALAGAWYVVGEILAELRPGSWSAIGLPVGSVSARVTEQIGFFAGLGVAIVLFAGIAIGRLTVIPARAVAAAVPASATPDPAEPETEAGTPAAPGSGVTGFIRSKRQMTGSKAA